MKDHARSRLGYKHPFSQGLWKISPGYPFKPPQEVELANDVWSITVGFSRPWDFMPRDLLGNKQGPPSRSYKVVRIRDMDGEVLSVVSHSADMA